MAAPDSLWCRAPRADPVVGAVLVDPGHALRRDGRLNGVRALYRGFDVVSGARRSSVALLFGASLPTGRTSTIAPDSTRADVDRFCAALELGSALDHVIARVGLSELHHHAFDAPLGALHAYLVSNGWLAPWDRRVPACPLTLCSWVALALSCRCGQGRPVAAFPAQRVCHRSSARDGCRFRRRQQRRAHPAACRSPFQHRPGGGGGAHVIRGEVPDRQWSAPRGPADCAGSTETPALNTHSACSLSHLPPGRHAGGAVSRTASATPTPNTEPMMAVHSAVGRLVRPRGVRSGSP